MRFSWYTFAGEEKLHSHVLSIENVDRHKGGVYICTANNRVGQPASSQVVLHVLCKYARPHSPNHPLTQWNRKAKQINFFPYFRGCECVCECSEFRCQFNLCQN
ncbi:GL20559 [Drosophila persimilis]|uniref:GL20559 n=1 Tax=Drosophila persimilis TaxID=7234 RepID=B4GNV7_DROPE|nr:GL20559 [Drosophila persimilis]